MANDLFEILDKLDKKNTKWIDSLPDEEKKSLNPYMLMRWLSGSNDRLQILLLNELVNSTVWNIPDNLELHLYLLSICGSGISHRRKFYKTKKITSNMSIDIIKKTYKYSTSRAEEVVGLLQPDQLIQMAKNLGYQDDDIARLEKELGIKTVKRKKTI